MARILVVDDEIEICEMLKKKLVSLGYEIETALNGKVAMRLQRENPFDLIITDIFMPEKEGIETIRELRRDYPHIKIIAVTGGYRYGPGELLEAARMLGADRSFSKPFRLKDIQEAVEDLLGK